MEIGRFINGQTVSLILFFIGLYGVLTQRNIVKTIIAVNMMDVGGILFLITVNYRPDSIPPIGHTDLARMADPLPQALMITAIVIGISVTAVSLTVFIGLFRRYGTADWATIAGRSKAK